MKTVLLVSYTFPPQYDVSARRAAKLCKYLPATGWRPVVLTKDWERDIAPEDRRAYSIVSDPAALAALGDVMVVRAAYRTRDNSLRRLHQRLGGVYDAGQRDAVDDNDPMPNADGGTAATRRASRWTPPALTRRALSLFAPTFGDFPDAFRGWVEPAVRTGVEFVRRERVDAICSLCPPASAHVVASEIARCTGLPWVAQFDDLYSFHLERQHRVAWRAYADHRHREWMRQATLAGAITPAMLAYVRRTYGLDGDVVMVGFDPEENPPVDRHSGSQFRLAYTGSIYPGDQRPDLLFDALDRVVRSSGSDAPSLELVLAGTGGDADLRALLSAYPAAARVCRFVGRLAPEDALRLQREADALVLLNCTNPTPDEGTLSYPAKTFEYLNAGRPILAIPNDPGGWGDRLISDTGTGVTVGSPAEAADVLMRWIEQRRVHGRVAYHGDADAIAAFSQPRQVATLGRLLDRAMAKRS